MIPNPLSIALGMDGAALCLIIWGLLFIEECGLPLPFVPGDLLLLVGGIAIAEHRVDPVLLAAGSCLVVTAGALVAHALFGMIRQESVQRVARALHLTRALGRVTTMVQASGWRGVIVGRLVPGLRVHTNEVAGILHMRRAEFLAGLVPSVLIYVAVFTSVGFLFGGAALSAIQNSEHWASVFIAGGLLIGAAMLLWKRSQRHKLLAHRSGVR